MAGDVTVGADNTLDSGCAGNGSEGDCCDSELEDHGEGCLVELVDL